MKFRTIQGREITGDIINRYTRIMSVGLSVIQDRWKIFHLHQSNPKTLEESNLRNVVLSSQTALA